MKKFDRLPPEKRKEEIQQAALSLFYEKGFAATTMENIVERVTLSKGGVYRLYPSTDAILSDLMLEGMRLRNAFYEERVRKEIESGGQLTLPFLVEMIGDSLLLYPEVSAVYAEFLWEKKRNPHLEQLYQQICETTVRETGDLIHRFGADALLPSGGKELRQITGLMNAAVLSMYALDMRDCFPENRNAFCSFVLRILKSEPE